MGNMAPIVEFSCKTCKKSVKDYASNKRSAYCSLPCYWESKKGSTGYWLGKKRPDVSGPNSGSWKGDDVGYAGVHTWVYKILGKPRKCERCLNTQKKVYHWSNISGEYKRELNDWQRLCVSCHSKFDRARA